MDKSKIDGIIDRILRELEYNMQKNEHLTPTLNDIYDTFCAVNLKIEHNDTHSEIITKELKTLRENQMNKRRLIEIVLKEIIVPSLHKHP